jgi:hypothetical protein
MPVPGESEIKIKEKKMKKRRNLFNLNVMLLSLCLVIITLLLCSCYRSSDRCCSNDGVIGSGMVVEEIRDVSSFDSIIILGSCKLFFRKDAVQSLLLVGEDNILPVIETYVENGTLVIGNKQSYSSRIGIKVYVSMEEIKKFTIAGASDIIGEEDFTTDELHLEIIGAGKIELGVTAQTMSTSIAGSGELSLRGSADHHSIEIAGAGEINAFDLEVKTYNITISGSGNCRIFVTEELYVAISGSGTIYYRGNPAVINSSIIGTGQLIKL